MKMTRMSEEETRGLAGTILIIAILFLAFIIWVQLQLIYLSRFMFWFDVIFIPVSLGFGVFFFVSFMKNEDYFDTSQNIYFTLSWVCVGLLVFSVLTIAYFYDHGYSDEALLKEAELKGQLEGYKAIINLLSGQTAKDIANQAVEESLDSLCQANKQYSCDEIKGYYKIYVDIKGYKDSADSIAGIWR